MPKPDQNKGDQEVEVGSPGYNFTMIFERQGKIYIIAQPGSQGDMPAAPESGDGLCSKWAVEIRTKPETQQPC